MKMRVSSRSGFTLIELSIVLVIIGLIVGGILTGRDLIRASELRSILTDAERFRTAVATFTGKYSCLPGDCAKAEAFFGTDSLACPRGGGTGTCNGNGDGRIDWPLESFRLWQQLALGGLIAGTYPGMDAADQPLIGINSPESHIPRVGYGIGYLNYAGLAVGYDLPDTVLANRIVVGGQINTVFPWAPTEVSFMSVYEATRMDLKIDDGRPASGTMTVLPGGNDAQQVPSGPCATLATTSADPATRYFQSNSDVFTCDLVLKLNQ